MNNMEEKLWEYIDGTCTDAERTIIESLIEKDQQWREAYLEILQFNSEMSATTLDEPSMPFTYNVMEAIRLQ